MASLNLASSITRTWHAAPATVKHTVGPRSVAFFGERRHRASPQRASLLTGLAGEALPHLQLRKSEHSQRSPSVKAAASAATAPSQAASADGLVSWLVDSGFPPVSSTVKVKDAQDQQRGITVTAAKKIAAGETIFNIPENFSVTALDVASHEVLSPATSANLNDLASLALWLLWETAQGDASPWAPYVRTFSAPSLSPLLWTAEERATLLKGHSGLPEIEQRLAEIDGYYGELYSALLEPQASLFPADCFSPQRFREAFVSVLSRAVFLPEAGIFALVPIADLVRHSPSSRALFEYSPNAQAVVLRADKTFESGQEIFACRGPELPNLDLALQSGRAVDGNPHDVITYTASLVPTDPLFMLKKQILQEEGFAETQVFPLYADRFPRQLLSYLRLARLQDAAQFASVTFRTDAIVSEGNEYEVLMLLLSECKERLLAFPQALEDDLRTLNVTRAAPGLLQRLGARGRGADPEDGAPVDPQKERLAAQLRATEKTILSKTVTALRMRLAPIRGIPTKSGMGDPNLEIKEMFALMEASFSAPKNIISSVFGKKK